MKIVKYTAERWKDLELKIYSGETIQILLEKCKNAGFVPFSVDAWDDKEHLVESYFVK